MVHFLGLNYVQYKEHLSLVLCKEHLFSSLSGLMKKRRYNGGKSLGIPKGHPNVRKNSLVQFHYSGREGHTSSKITLKHKIYDPVLLV